MDEGGAVHGSALEDCQKKLESSREPEPSQTTIVPGGLNSGAGRFFRLESAGFMQKLERVAVAGELASPPSLSVRFVYPHLTDACLDTRPGV